VSLRRRLHLAVVLVTLCLTVTAGSVFLLTRNYLYDRLEANLDALPGDSRGQAGASVGPDAFGLRSQGDRPRAPRADLLPTLAHCDHNRLESYVVLLSDAGGTKARPCDEPEVPLVDAALLERSITDPDQSVNATVSDQNGDRHLIRVRPLAPDRFLILGVATEPTDRIVRQITLFGAVGAVVVAIALIVVVRWMMRRGLDPLDHIAQTADAIAGGDRSLRVQAGRPGDEVGRVAVALNGMLDEADQSFARQQRNELRLRQFISDASHELRTPLTSIRGYADLIRLGGLRDAQLLDDAVRRIDEEGGRMSRLIDDMLTLAQFDSHRPLVRRPTSLRHVLDDCARDSLAADRRWPVSVAPGADVVAMVDEDTIRQLVSNLVGNARTHTPAGTPVELRVSFDGPLALIEVTDRGPGVPPDLIDAVFDRFVRADLGRSRNQGGNGLGLAIVASIAAAHGGSVAVRNNDQGATFSCSIPLATCDREPADAIELADEPLIGNS
jgi:two-component system, OmpR family, sensor kinase